MGGDGGSDGDSEANVMGGRSGGHGVCRWVMAHGGHNGCCGHSNLTSPPGMEGLSIAM